MKLRERIRRFRRSPKKYLVTLALSVLVVVLGWYSMQNRSGRDRLVYADSLDLVAAEVNGEELTLRDLAFYVAYEEAEVEERAIAYDPDDTIQFWNLHTDGVFIRNAARNAAIQMAIHDEIFYRMAIGRSRINRSGGNDASEQH